MLADVLFVFQLLCATLFGGSQAVKMLSETQGVSISWIICSEAFFGLNLFLVLLSYRKTPSRVTFQAILCYTVWLIFGLLQICIMIAKSATPWNTVDTFTTTAVFFGTIIVMLLAMRGGQSISHPVVKSAIATLAIAVPQLTMGYNIYLLGGAGVSAITVIVGHISVVTRLGQLLSSFCKSHDGNCLGALTSETANWLSWIVCTIIWVFR